MTPNELSGLVSRFCIGGLLAMALLALDRLARRRKATLAVGQSARGILDAGYVLGVFLLCGALVTGAGVGEGDSLAGELKWLAIYAALAGVLFFVTARLGSRLLLRGGLRAQLEKNNLAAAVAVAGHTVATAVIVAANIAGDDLEMIGVSLAFFVLSQFTLHGFVVLFRTITAYDDAAEIEGGNAAAALSYAGVTVGLAIIIGHAAEGSFEGWGASLRGYAKALVFCASLYVVRQFVVQTILCGARPTLTKGPLDKAIGQDRDLGLAALEAAAYVGTALLLGHVS
jgi:uncharacterized membrane protein YjfL (UPF0719 family)